MTAPENERATATPTGGHVDNKRASRGAVKVFLIALCVGVVVAAVLLVLYRQS